MENKQKFLVLAKKGMHIEDMYIIKADSEEEAKTKFQFANNCKYSYVSIRNIEDLPYVGDIYTENP